MKKQRSSLKVALNLIGLVKSYIGVMILAIFTGSLGHLAAIAVPTLGAFGISYVFSGEVFSLSIWIGTLIVCAILRAFLAYFEQLANHYIAFSILAKLRDMFFKKLRKLAPAKLDGADKGKFISIITSDIELLEVYYAHTLSPIGIAILVSISMILFLGYYNFYYGLLAGIFYLIVAVVIPIITSKWGRKIGVKNRERLSQLNNLILDSFRGIKECIQYRYGKKRLDEVGEVTGELQETLKEKSKIEGNNQGLSALVLMIGYVLILILARILFLRGEVTSVGVIVPVVAFMSSFGPVLALSNLSSSFMLTVACGNRVLDLLEEEPVVVEVLEGENIEFEQLEVVDVDFAYKEEKILDAYNLTLKKGEIVGLTGKSGVGKSTLLKLIMRFYDPISGAIKINNKNVKKINSHSLRRNEAYLTQSTYIFKDTILNNIKIAKSDATFEEVKAACKKASIDQFIERLPNGYQTSLGELGNTMSGGEKQRIGLARVFLHNASLVLLDEPTSNIDSLNEGIILNSIYEESKDKAILLVSHRKSTQQFADRSLTFDETRPS